MKTRCPHDQNFQQKSPTKTYR